MEILWQPCLVAGRVRGFCVADEAGSDKLSLSSPGAGRNISTLALFQATWCAQSHVSPGQVKTWHCACRSSGGSHIYEPHTAMLLSDANHSCRVTAAPGAIVTDHCCYIILRDGKLIAQLVFVRVLKNIIIIIYFFNFGEALEDVCVCVCVCVYIYTGAGHIIRISSKS